MKHLQQLSHLQQQHTASNIPQSQNLNDQHHQHEDPAVELFFKLGCKKPSHHPLQQLSAIVDVPFQLSFVHPKQHHQFSFGIDELDSVLGGGLARKLTVQIFGAPGDGKSHFALQLGVLAAGNNFKVLYFNTEMKYDNEKAAKMTTRFRLPANTVLDNFYDLPSVSHMEFMAQLRAETFSQTPYDVYIIDSLTYHLRAEYMPTETGFQTELNE